MANKFSVGQLVWQITGDTSKLNKSLKTSEKDVGKVGKAFGKVTTGIKVGFASVAVAGVAKLSKELLNIASDGEETNNKFKVVFRDVASEAETTAERISESYGLSSQASKELLSDTGDLLTGFGFTGKSALDLSTQVNELAVDLASFTNFSGGAKGASEALTKALLGERESVKALGISILDADVKAKVLENTQKGLTFETERQAKAYATLELAQQQSQNAIGDYARSADSYANTMRRAEASTQDLGAELGRVLLPVAQKGVGLFADLTKSIATYIKEVNDIKDAEKALKSGNASIDQRILLQEKEVALIKEQANGINESAELAKKSAHISGISLEQQQERLKTFQKRLKDEESLLENLKEQKRIGQERAEAEKASRDEEAEALKLKQKEAEEEARRIGIRKESLSVYDKEIEKIELLTDLEVLSKEEAIQKKISAETAYQNSLIEQGYNGQKELSGLYTIGDQALLDSIERRKQLQQEYAEATKKEEKDLSDERVKFKETSLSNLEKQGASKKQLLEIEYREQMAMAEKLGADTTAIEQYYANERQQIIEQEAQAKKEAYLSYASTILSGVSQIIGAIQGLNSQISQSEINRINEDKDRQLEALEEEKEALIENGADKTAVNKEYADKKKEIEKQSAKESAKVKYESDLANWKLSVASATATGAQAIINGFATQPFFPLGLINGALATTLTGIQLATLKEAKPQAPSFASGGIVPNIPSIPKVGDQGTANVNAGELILNEAQQATVADKLNNQVTLNLYLDGQMFYNGIYEASRNGQVQVDLGAIIG